MDHGSSRAQIISAVFPCERIDRVFPEYPRFRRFGDCFQYFLFHPQLICPDRRVDVERRHPGILADRGGVVARHVDVRCDSFEGKRRPGSGGFTARCLFNSEPDIRRKICRGVGDKRQHALFEDFHCCFLLDGLYAAAIL